MDKDTFFQVKTTLNVKGKLLDLSSPLVMGILNITPDSFYAGSRLDKKEEILKRVETFIAEGVDVIDIGAYSSRPGAEDVSAQEEMDRLLPVITAIKESFPEAILSVDTFRGNVAEAAIGAGAHIINDISGGELDNEMFATVAKLQVPYVLMHMKGTPKNMSSLTQYDDLFGDLMEYFSGKINHLKALGVKDIILDPGFGFAKNTEQNYYLLSRINEMRILGYPVLVGISRKTMIWKTLGIKPEEALNGTTVLNVLALQNGASILRVHDVMQAKECIKLLDVYNRNKDFL